ncbi:hypothetical protein RFI_01961 [Reticulomyxa filosa]|uniref:Uncharacterized protein n=1 Tax=Reticulomyxa filosa TaxID=46433 RepID=X6PAF6_RETFI|nr:hypothetical protein RFI_01961 [Reticulomyxa filosa]|eukprot:ETO35113.1 hypothetical protein RFI_01961 [Reticulomyxa filosa]
MVFFFFLQITKWKKKKKLNSEWNIINTITVTINKGGENIWAPMVDVCADIIEEFGAHNCNPLHHIHRIHTLYNTAKLKGKAPCEKLLTTLYQHLGADWKVAIHGTMDKKITAKWEKAWTTSVKNPGSYVQKRSFNGEKQQKSNVKKTDKKEEEKKEEKKPEVKPAAAAAPATEAAPVVPAGPTVTSGGVTYVFPPGVDPKDPNLVQQDGKWFRKIKKKVKKQQKQEVSVERGELTKDKAWIVDEMAKFVEKVAFPTQADMTKTF